MVIICDNMADYNEGSVSNDNTLVTWKYTCSLQCRETDKTFLQPTFFILSIAWLLQLFFFQSYLTTSDDDIISLFIFFLLFFICFLIQVHCGICYDKKTSNVFVNSKRKSK